jgi:hypothetical protein
MKTIRTFLLTLFLSITYGIVGQEFIGSNTRLMKTRETVIDCKTLCEEQRIIKTSSSEDVGLIKLNGQTNEFNFNVPLYNILSTNRNDSISSLNKSVVANYRAIFPISDLDFFTSGTQTSLQIQGELTVNGRTRPATMSLNLQEALPYNLDNRDVHSYPVLVSFALEISPADYNLDFETINFTRSITIEVRNGVVNRSNER